MPHTYPHDCAVKNCGRKRAKWSRFCVGHQHRLTRYGHELQRPMDKTNAYDAQLAVARRYITLHKDTQAAAAAFELARALMEYRADTPLAADQKLQEAWQIQRLKGADPWELLARVSAFYLFMDHRPGYFRNQKAEDVALGRLCLHSKPLAGHRYSAAVYAPAGELIRRHLGQFALALIRKVTRDADRVAQLKAKSAAL